MSDTTLAWAERTASLIVDEGLTDWPRARQKAAHNLGLDRHTHLTPPSDEDIITAIRAHLAIFHADDHPLQLRAQRQLALLWMQRLAAYEPRLCGPVAEGWAHRESRIMIELAGIDDKSLQILLLDKGIEAEPVGRHHSTGEWDIASEDWHLRLRLLTPGKGRLKAERLRLNAKELETLINAC